MNIPVPVDLTFTISSDQETWLIETAKKLNVTTSEALQNILDFNMEAAKKDPELPGRTRIRRDFESLVVDVDDDRIAEARDLLRELELQLDIAEKYNEARNLQLRLNEMRGDFSGELK